jgi:hypothetical protein
MRHLSKLQNHSKLALLTKFTEQLTRNMQKVMERKAGAIVWSVDLSTNQNRPFLANNKDRLKKMGQVAFLGKLIVIFCLLVRSQGDVLEKGCVIKPCVMITKEGLLENQEQRQCIWCDHDSKQHLPESEIVALSEFAHACAESRAELVFPRNNWCVGYKLGTVDTTFDPEEKAGCEADMITDPCTGHVLQRSITSSTNSEFKAAPWAGISCSSNNIHVTEVSINVSVARSLSDLYLCFVVSR